MSANTSPDNITYPISTDAFGPLETSFAVLATSTQNALNNTKTYRVADFDYLNAQTGVAQGAIATVIEGGALFSYTGTKWVQQTMARFASGAARDSAYNKAGGTFRTQFATTYRADLAWGPEQWFDLYNVSTNQYGATPAGWYPPYGSGEFVQEYYLPTNNAFTITTRNAGAMANTFYLPCLGVYELEWVISRGATAAMSGDITFALDVIGGTNAVSVNIGDDIQNARSTISFKCLYVHTDAAHFSVQMRADPQYVAAGTKTYYANSKMYLRYLRPRHA